MMKLLLVSAIFFTVMHPVSAGANHEGLIYGPCGVETGYIHMTSSEVSVQVQERIDNGDLDSDAVIRNSVDIIVYGTPHDILIAAGVIQEYAVNKFDQVLRYDDPFWSNIVRETSGFTEWETGCYGLTYMTTTTTTTPTYSLTSAESDSYPTEETRILLQERYPLSASNKYHFDIDTAVVFLQQGGALSGLDNVWNIYEES